MFQGSLKMLESRVKHGSLSIFALDVRATSHFFSLSLFKLVSS